MSKIENEYLSQPGIEYSLLDFWHYSTDRFSNAETLT